MPLSVNSYMALGTRCLGLAVDYYSVRFISQSGAYRVQGKWLKQSNADCSENCGDLQNAGSDTAPPQAQKAVSMLSFWSAVVRLSSFQEQLDIEILKCKGSCFFIVGMNSIFSKTCGP